VRRSVLTVAAIVGFAWACGHGGSGTSPSPTPAKPLVPLTLSLAVTNMQWNTGVVNDFTIVITGGGFASGFTLPAAEGEQRISIEQSAPYKVSVSGPEGYIETISAGCAGTNPQGPVSCSIMEKEAPFGCDAVLWDPVYRQDRLKVLSSCETTIATIASARIEPDGDADVLADPDAAYARLLGPGNEKEAAGKLVIEIPCQGPVTQADAMGTCNGFKGTRLSPPLAAGERIVAAAHWVEDRNHGNQRELHGARIRRLPR